MELRHLRYCVALAEVQNFTRAAERTHVTQSTLSHQIKQLEDELDVTLFNRDGKSVSLTQAGRDFVDTITPILKQVDAAVGALKASPDQLTGELRIAATHSFNVQLIPQCLAAFMEKFPQVKVIVEELSGDQIAQGLENGTLDLGISYRPAVPRGLWFEPLFNEELKLIMSPTHPLAKRKRVRMVELNGLPLALLTRNFSTRQLLDECFEAAGAEPQVVAEMNAISPMVELVRRTHLCSIVSDNALSGEPCLVAVALENPTPIRTPGLLWNRNHDRPLATRYMANIIRELALQGQPR
ncbi:LysR substrate-binding domain-containing protein [Saccharospirillum alexandrii]|uniref:LysR substrate-binding domain-containing protein n=1 Tax=Saccharospirillum alexandrii TaxID=2448477 RepID=UPI000FDAF9BB|nr:LysR substrate-binding domain-containing protein [Saccharospirillum alexandrii]